MDKNDLTAFVSKFPDFSTWKGGAQTDLFAYYLTGLEGVESFTATDIDECFNLLSLKRYMRLRSYLSEQAKAGGGKYIKAPVGYRLERNTLEMLRMTVEDEEIKIKVEAELKDLLPKITDPYEKDFLDEVLKCYSVKAYRSAIVMTWNLALHHLHTFIFKNHLGDFNASLRKNPYNKITEISDLDSFGDLPEWKFIETTRAAKIISNDVRKILDEKLGIRNTAAHPSKVVIGKHKATEFILDLVENIIQKY